MEDVLEGNAEFRKSMELGSLQFPIKNMVTMWTVFYLLLLLFII
jgi:hypothetical protein